ncbi:MAG: HAD family hydrolase [Candidatus Thorarchaeota archaeon]
MIRTILFDFWDTIVTSTPEQLITIKEQRISAIKKLIRKYKNKRIINLKADKKTADGLLNNLWYEVSSIRANQLIDIGEQGHGKILAKIMSPKTDDEQFIELCSQALSSVTLTDKTYLIPGTRDILETIHSSGYKIGLVSNTGLDPSWRVQELLKYYNIDHYFDIMSFSDQLGYLKPHPKVFQQIKSLFNLNLNEIVMVGDDPTADIMGAKLMGVHAILKPYSTKKVLFKFDSEEERELHPDKIIYEFDELIPSLNIF